MIVSTVASRWVLRCLRRSQNKRCDLGVVPFGGSGTRKALLALALVTGSATAFAQKPPCGLIDPMDVSRKCDTTNATPTKAPGIPAAPARSADSGQLPGKGQQVCAFFDTRTNRCLTVRPNTRDYDAAVQAGIDAAMMGMQVQTDALHRAAEMGVVPGAGGAPGPALVPQGQIPTASAVPPDQFVRPPSARSPIGGAVRSDLTSCIRSRVQAVESATGKSASPSDVTQAMQSCAQ